jgi:hypothetical protein
MSLKRYEILLPLRYNDGSPIEPEKFEQTRRELIAQFQGATFDPQPVRGFWVQQGTEYADLLVRVILDVEDTPEVHSFFNQFKETLKQRFRQIEIWISYHDIGRV